MCLAVPAKIIQIKMTDDDLLRTGVVDFSGVQKEISLAYVPEAVQGDYVIVHAGFAISLLDESEALESLQAFDDLAAFELTLWTTWQRFAIRNLPKNGSTRLKR